MTEANAINASTIGIVGNTGTGFTGSAVTQHDVLIGGATSSTISSVGPGSAGQVLQSGGGAANPSYSTATYPSTAGTAGNFLVSDGTNFVSKFTNLSIAYGQLNTAQIIALTSGTSLNIIPAPAAGSQIFVQSGAMAFNYVSGSALTGGSTIKAYFGTSGSAGGTASNITIGSATATGTAAFYTTGNATNPPTTSISQGVGLSVSGASYANGGSSVVTVDYCFYYFVLPI